MTEDQLVLYAIQGAIRQLPQETQEAIETVAAQIRALRDDQPEGAVDMAVALVGAELAAV